MKIIRVNINNKPPFRHLKKARFKKYYKVSYPSYYNHAASFMYGKKSSINFIKVNSTISINDFNNDFYCSADSYNHGFCGGRKHGLNKNIRRCVPYCPACRRKYYTPEQYFEEYGEEYPDDGAVYVDIDVLSDEKAINTWMITTYLIYKETVHRASNTSSDARIKIFGAFCACTPWGNPRKHKRNGK